MITERIELKQDAPTMMMGMRQSAIPLRLRIASAIERGERVDVDFTGVEATHSFLDELIGVLVGVQGPDVLRLIAFKGCSDTVKGILQFVANDRAKDFRRLTH